MNPFDFDLTHEDREEIQCLLAEIELNPERLKPLLAELVLNRKVVGWARDYSRRFPTRLQAVLVALRRKSDLERLAADSRAELERG